MRPKILAIQFRKNITSVEHEQACVRRAISDNADVTFVSALNDSFNWEAPELFMEDFAGVILGGSGDFDFDGGRPDDDPDRAISYTILATLRPLFVHLFEYDIPTLGICYGHQLLGAFAGAQVINIPEQQKSRSHEIKLLIDGNNHFLFTDIPTSFHAFYGHKDSLDRVPEGATLVMAGGDQCKISALQYKKNIYTTQFHPELTLADMIERIKNSPGYLPEGVAVEELFKDGSDANKILKNFGAMVANQVTLAVAH